MHVKKSCQNKGINSTFNLNSLLFRKDMALLNKKQLQQSKTELAKETSSAEESDASEESAEAEQPIESGAGWADSIAKVLSTSKPKAKKTLALSRAKKLKPAVQKSKSAKEEFGFEVAAGDFEVENKAEKPAAAEQIKEEADEKDIKPKNLKLLLRNRPSWKDIERERALKKVATKGVVQLFNAVRVQQKQLEEQLEAAGPLDSRRDAVLNNIDKRKFLDVLMSGNRAKSENVDGQVKDEDESSSSSDEEATNEQGAPKKKTKWSVLEPDFLTSKKSKHWDEEEDDDEAAVASDATVESDD